MFLVADVSKKRRVIIVHLLLTFSPIPFSRFHATFFSKLPYESFFSFEINYFNLGNLANS